MAGPSPYNRSLHTGYVAIRLSPFRASTFGKGAPPNDAARISGELQNDAGAL
jgi:hypothetical protein